MARCPFATWRPISGSSGPQLGGPFKIVHHTTEGSTAQGAMDAFRRNRSDPHFTVDATTIFQHVDTAEGARALRNDVGGSQTNRDSAVQIELVGFAHLPKDSRALTNVARLCRWIEAQHGIPRKWPSGRPLPAKNGKDPGGHNRDAATWDSTSGHFGHCHVPENSHWDPAYSAAEADFILAATFSEDGALVSPAPPPRPAARRPSKMAPAVTIKTFQNLVVPHLGSRVKRYQQFHLSDRAEEDDPTCGPYRRSPLYLVSESFEGGTTTPLLGMERYFQSAGIPCDAVHISPTGIPSAASRILPIASSTHGGFDNDKGTQQQVIAFIKR